MTIRLLATLAMITSSLLSCQNAGTGEQQKSDSTSAEVQAGARLKEEMVAIPADTTTMECFMVYDENRSGKRPVVLVVPEWWGLTDYPKSRARQLAELGYFALVVDLYGRGRTAEDPGTAGELSGLFYSNPALATTRLEAALAKAKTYPQADSSRTAAIGYCFGGSMVLNAAKMGAPITGVVSFHGGLAGVTPQAGLTKADMLVCHGTADKFISPQELAQFKKQLDSVKVSYTFKEYPDAVHAFSNPTATENGKKFNIPIAYNGPADTASWKDMRDFFDKIFK